MARHAVEAEVETLAAAPRVAHVRMASTRHRQQQQRAMKVRPRLLHYELATCPPTALSPQQQTLVHRTQGCKIQCIYSITDH